MKKSKKSYGFTYIEVIVVMAILSIFFGIASINLLKVQRSSEMNAAISILISDLKEQQTKAMTGFSGTLLVAQDYGIHFNENDYVIFDGSTYSAGSESNFSVELAPSLSFSSVSFPDGNVVFEKGSGEILGYSPGSNEIAITDETNSETVNIQLNFFGVSSTNR